VLGRLSLAVQRRVRPWVWLAPTLVFAIAFLLWPSINTVLLSFRDASSSEWVGLVNYRALAADPSLWVAVRNTALWVLAFPTLTVLLGLLLALLADRVRYEAVVKSLIFLPMAVSFVAAGVIWRFVYDFRPPPLPQTGTLNALLMWAIPGFAPQAWLIDNPPFNNLALIIAAVWVWTGFCLVILSAGLKGIPVEILEAAAVDGASGPSALRHVVLPMLKPTTIVLITTMVIFALKAFDIVYVMTSGNYDTEVIASRVYREMFTSRDFGRASAVAVLLLVAIMPVVALNLRRFRQEEAPR
jgi:alpha-glucoside transport system permease protein